MPRRVPSSIILALCATLTLAAAPTPAVSDVVRETLPNGLRVVIVRAPLAPVVTTEMTYLVGGVNSPTGFPGTAHAQEHMMFRASAGLSTDQISAIGSGLGGALNAFTRETVTQFVYTVPTPDLDVALHVEALRMRGALDTADDWAQERGAIEQEVAGRLSSSLYRVRAAALSKVFAGTPYADDPLGTVSSFERTDAHLLKSFYDLWYAPNNAVLVIAGDVDPPATLTLARSLFGAIPASPIARTALPQLPPMRAAKLYEESDLPLSFAFIAYRLPGIGDRDFPAARILADVLNNRRARIYQLVPQGKALFAGYGLSALPPASMGLAVAGVPPGQSPWQMADALKGIIGGYQREGVPRELVDAAKRRLLAQALFRRTSVEGLAAAWSEAIAVDGRGSPDDDLNALRTVSAADVDRVLRERLDAGAAVTGIVERRSFGASQVPLESGGGETFNRPPAAHVTLPDWASKVFDTLAVAPTALRPTESTLPNGVRLVVQPESLSPTVTLIGRVRTNPDIETAPGKEGVSEVLDQLFAFGTESRDQVQFDTALDDIAATLSAGSEFSLEVPAADLAHGIELLSDALVHPRLPEANFTSVRDQLAAVTATAERSPGAQARLYMYEQLYPRNDPILRHATERSVHGLTLADVRQYYRTAFRPDLTTIAIVGEVSPRRANALVQHWFGGWQAAGPRPNVDYPPAPENRAAERRFDIAATPQDRVTLIETVPITRSSPDYVTLQVANYAFGHQSFTSRLFQDLRVGSGLVYYVGGDLDAGPTRSTYRIDFACDPRNTKRARDIVLRDLRAMQSAPLSDGELAQAKAQLVRQLTLFESSESSIAHVLLQREEEGLPLDESSRIARRILDVSADDVRAALAKYLSADRFVEVRQGPSMP